MARTKRIAKVSNRDRTLYTLANLQLKSFRQDEFLMKAKAHSERAGEAWSQRMETNIRNELDTLLAEGLVTWDEERKECNTSQDMVVMLTRNKLSSSDKSLSLRNAYSAESKHWRAVFPPTKRKTRLDYMWEFIRSRGKISTLLRQIAALVKEKEEQNGIIADLRHRLAQREQSGRVVTLPTPGPSTPTPHAVDAYPTPRSEADAEESPLLLSPSLPSASVHPNRAPLTPVSNPRPILRKRILQSAPATPSPLARHVQMYADVDDDVAMDEGDADADNSSSMPADRLRSLQGAEDSMVLDDAAEDDDDDKDELSDMDLEEEFEPLDGCATAFSSERRAGKGMFMRMTDVFGNFVGDLFTSGRARSVGPQSDQEKPLDEILPELSPELLVNANGAAVDASSIITNTAAPSYCSRAVSPLPSTPDLHEVEIEELKETIARLKADLEAAQRTLTEKDARIEELQGRVEQKERRLRLLMNLHEQMSAEFEKDRAGL
ncbi:hypothetical protein DAEQUDRAFT_769180 [Daedalea quercina L-15889]|uniref:Uncharacterized protein n=1 Tax=Daedalea quercina L-15889 TaxID=1314783 RepID=A0A165LYX4_9APHY|nr:hypothetical protein DAEQUDRAFT_769180 [Daedalea quercina L-15889]